MTSAFSFESFYAELRHSFTPGTMSPVKQMLEKVILRRALSHHCCETSIFLSAKNTQLECNNLFYTFSNNTHNMYLIESVDEHDNDVLNCYVQGRYVCHFPETPDLNWSSVGVYKLGGLSDEIVQVNKSCVKGKF